MGFVQTSEQGRKLLRHGGGFLREAELAVRFYRSPYGTGRRSMRFLSVRLPAEGLRHRLDQLAELRERVRYVSCDGSHDRDHEPHGPVLLAE